MIQQGTIQFMSKIPDMLRLDTNYFFLNTELFKIQYLSQIYGNGNQFAVHNTVRSSLAALSSAVMALRRASTGRQEGTA